MTSHVDEARVMEIIPQRDQPVDQVRPGTPVAESELPDISLRLLDRYHEAEDIMSFRFEPDRPVNYQAGQYLHCTLPHPTPDERGTSRYFTIASAPSEGYIMFSTRLGSLSSSFKQALTHLKPGAVMTASGPSGRFVYKPNEQRVVFIAGGIGITPLRSMLVELTASPGDVEITLLYANRTPDIAFKPLFDALARAHPRVKVVYIVSHPTADWTGPVGRIDAAFIAQHVPDLTTSLFYTSGPPPMVKAIAQAVTELGVGRERIKREIFSGYDQ